MVSCISPSSGIFFLHLQNILKTQFYFPLFELIKFSVNRKCSIFCHLHEKISLGVHISSLTVFGYTLQYFLFIISFLPVTPAANTRVCFHLHSLCQVHSEQKLICLDENKSGEKRMPSTLRKKQSHFFATMTCFL
jgi:hypothetical protein